MNKTLFAALAALAFLAAPAAAQSILNTNVGRDSYGAYCVSVYVNQAQTAHSTQCAGKGVITPHDTDCAFFINNSLFGQPVLYFVCVPLPFAFAEGPGDVASPIESETRIPILEDRTPLLA